MIEKEKDYKFIIIHDPTAMIHPKCEVQTIPIICYTHNYHILFASYERFALLTQSQARRNQKVTDRSACLILKYFRIHALPPKISTGSPPFLSQNDQFQFH